MPKKFTLTLTESEDGEGVMVERTFEGHEGHKCSDFCDLIMSIDLTLQANLGDLILDEKQVH